VHLLVWNRITARERERDGVEDDKRETKPVGARGGPSTPPSGRDDEVPFVGAVLVEPGFLKLRVERVTAEDAPASGSFNRNFARETLINLTVEEGGAGLDAGVSESAL